MGKKPKGFGFDPDACKGCPKRKFVRKGDEDGLIERIGNMIAGNKKGYYACGLCGCPTEGGMLMDRRQQPPENCVRLEQHRTIGRDRTDGK